MGITNIVKRKYFDGRVGMVALSPILAISNFIFLAYNFTDLKNYVIFEIFAVIFLIIFLVSVTIIGNVFRNVQTPMDIKLQYEKNIEQAKTMIVLLNAVKANSNDESINERIAYHQRIVNKDISE